MECRLFLSRSGVADPCTLYGARRSVIECRSRTDKSRMNAKQKVLTLVALAVFGWIVAGSLTVNHPFWLIRKTSYEMDSWGLDWSATHCDSLRSKRIQNVKCLDLTPFASSTTSRENRRSLAGTWSRQDCNPGESDEPARFDR